MFRWFAAAFMVLGSAMAAFAEPLGPPKAVTFPGVGDEFKQLRQQALDFAKSEKPKETLTAAENFIYAVMARFGPQSREELDALIDAADILQLSGASEDALEFSRMAMDLARPESVRLAAYSSDPFVYVNRNDISAAFRQFVDLAANSTVSDRTGLDDEAFRAFQKALIGRAAMAGWRSALRHAPDQDPAINAVRSGFFWYADHFWPVTALLLPRIEKLLPEMIEAGTVTQGEIDLATGLLEINAKMPEALAAAPEHAESLLPRIYGLKELQQKLGDDEAVLAYNESPDGVMAVFAVTSDGYLFKPLDAFEPEISPNVAAIRAAMGVPAPRSAKALVPPPPDKRQTVLRAAYELHEMLIAPVAPVLRSRRKIHILADGAMAQLPFEMLVSREPRPDESYADAAWLVREHAVTILPCLPLLFATPATHDLLAARFLSIADPDYRALAGTRYDRRETADVALLPPLPESRGEAQAIAAAFADSKVLAGGDATETALVQLEMAGELGKFGVILFATHGLLPQDTEETLRPSIALTPDTALYFGGLLADMPGQVVSDGLLEDSEISGLPINADLVILSACNTAAESRFRLDGYGGLASAFLQAGAKTVMVTHWPVNSQAAAGLTSAMFAAGSTGSIAERLRSAELAMIAKGGDHADPARWAPFTVYGQP